MAEKLNKGKDTKPHGVMKGTPYVPKSVKGVVKPCSGKSENVKSKPCGGKKGCK